MTKLRLNDQNSNTESSDESGYDLGADRTEVMKPLFPTSPTNSHVKQRLSPLQSPRVQLLSREGEVVEAMSPGGHITKRRARSRPVSAELLSSAQTTPEEQQVCDISGLLLPLYLIMLCYPEFDCLPPLCSVHRGALRGRNLSNSPTSSAELGSPPS